MLSDVFVSQTVTALIYITYFVVLLLEPWIKKHHLPKIFIDYFGSSGIIVAVTFYLQQLFNGSSIVTTRVSPEGVHSICMVLFLSSFFIFTFLPKLDTMRGMTLMIYLISLHELTWNILFYGFVKPSLVPLFLTFGLPTVSVMVLTVIVSWKRYRTLIDVPSFFTVAVAFIYGWIWISIGFPITVSTFEIPYLTQWFKNELVNMIEIGYVLTFIGTFLSSYFTMGF